MIKDRPTHLLNQPEYKKLPSTGDNDPPPPPPKMTQGVMTPLTPLHHLQQHP
jgi:hypothetical protein